MTATRNRIGEYTRALLMALEDGPMTREQLRGGGGPKNTPADGREAHEKEKPPKGGHPDSI